MSHPFVQADQDAAPEDTAALWLLRRDAGQDVESDPQFIAWRDGAPDNARAWAHAASIWQTAGSASGDDPLFVALRRDALQARPDRRPLVAALTAMAAALVVAVGLAWFPLSSRIGATPAQPGPSIDAAPTFAVAAGTPNTFALPDGSRVTLNANSAIAVDYRAGSRAVRLLRGQAYFSVVHDTQRPFTVATRARTITDLGTEFDVRLGDRAMTVTLAKGAVAVSAAPGRDDIRLSTPGQQLVSTPNQADAVTRVDLTKALSWRTRLLEFSETPLADAVAEVNRYGGPSAKVVDPTAATLPVSGQYRAGDPTRFAQSLAEVYRVRVRTRGDGGADITSR
ncbi:FecR family protein [Caulobacter segnis]